MESGDLGTVEPIEVLEPQRVPLPALERGERRLERGLELAAVGLLERFELGVDARLERAHGEALDLVVRRGARGVGAPHDRAGLSRRGDVEPTVEAAPTGVLDDRRWLAVLGHQEPDHDALSDIVGVSRRARALGHAAQPSQVPVAERAQRSPVAGRAGARQKEVLDLQRLDGGWPRALGEARAAIGVEPRRLQRHVGPGGVTARECLLERVAEIDRVGGVGFLTHTNAYSLRRMFRRAVAALSLGLVLHAGSALAAPTEAERARSLYDAALTAAEAGEPARAARLFAEADRLAPHPIALKSALKSALDADLAAIGMTLVTRAATRELSPEIVALVEQARARFEKRTGRIVVECGEPACRAQLDGAPVELGTSTWVDAGRHDVEARTAAAVARQAVSIEGGAVEVVRLAPRPASAPSIAVPKETTAPRRAEESGGGIHPAFFFVGLGISAVLGGVTIWSAVDTRDKHEAFDHTQAAADEGEAAQLRTNVLFGTTLGVTMATALVGALAVDWTGGPAPAATSAWGLSLSGRF